MKETASYLLACLVLLFTGCTTIDSESTRGGRWVVVHLGIGPEGWYLKDREVPVILRGAKAYLRRQLGQAATASDRKIIATMVSNWDTYGCQLFPMIEPDTRRRMVYLRFVPRRAPAEDRSGPLLVSGEWMLRYYPDKNEYSTFAVNTTNGKGPNHALD